MKVLFAVNNEKIAESITRKYQEEYKEIISSKTVYYFNAIIKELQKDKTYDRIVISEDLEMFANDNYQAIDKFIFEKMDAISDEATNAEGNDIPIILLCTDRRTKNDPLLIKLFGLGLYDILVGQDRSIQKVCSLMYKPRSKKEAKAYCRVEAENVEYKTEDKNGVSESEIQNILYHYKKIGNNIPKCVQSFDRIKAQYSDEQIKTIAQVLPVGVRVILEENSDAYRKVMGIKGRKQSGTSSLRESEYVEKEINSGSKLTKPVIIPTSVSTKKVNKIEKTEKEKKAAMEEKKRRIEEERIAREKAKAEAKRKEEERIAKEKAEAKRKEEERIAKEKAEAEKRNKQKNEKKKQEGKMKKEEVVEEVKRGRGRPRKNPIVVEETTEKKRRGRPRKNVEEQNNEIVTTNKENIKSKVKKDEVKSEIKEKSKSTKKTKNVVLKNDDEIEDNDILLDINEFENSNNQNDLLQDELVNIDEEFDDFIDDEIISNSNEQNNEELPGFDDDDNEYDYLDEEEEDEELPGFEDDDDEFDYLDEEEEDEELPGFEDDDDEYDYLDEEEEDEELPGFEDDEDEYDYSDEEEEDEELPGFEDDEDEYDYSDEEEEDEELPGFEDDEDEYDYSDEEEENEELPGFEDDDDEYDYSDEEEENEELPGFEDDDDEFEQYNDLEENDEFESNEENEIPEFEEEDEELPGFEDEDDEYDYSDEEEENEELPGFDDEDDDQYNDSDEDNKEEASENNELLDFIDEEVEDDDEEDEELPGFDDDDDEEENDNTESINDVKTHNGSFVGINNRNYKYDNDLANNIKDLQETENDVNYNAETDNLITSENKIIAFVGAPKNGTTFLVNNLAMLFSNKGIKTAILDLTKSKNTYYIYTANKEELRQKASACYEKLKSGVAEGIDVNKNLSVYTALPGEFDSFEDSASTIKTLMNNYEIILLDCDFETDDMYFKLAQEIYLVQSLDILTIQPLTGFLRDLKVKEKLEPKKLRVVINKEIRVNSLNEKAILGAMSVYKDPAMTYMTELFDRDTIKFTNIPFDNQAYSEYIEGIINDGEISIKRYPKKFVNSLNRLADMVYPVLDGKKSKKLNDYSKKSNTFSNITNSTLNKMKNNY